MSNANSIRAGKAFVELFADNSQLVRGLRVAEKQLKAFGSKVSSIGRQTFAAGAAAMSGLVGAGTYFANVGDSVAKAAKRTGMSAEAFSALGYAAELSGVSTEDLEAGVRKMQRTLAAAAGGSKSAQDGLAALGLTAESLLGLAPDRQMEVIADRLTRIRNPALQASAAMNIFGRNGANLLPLLQEGAAGMQALKDEAARLGLVVSTEDATAAEALNDAFDRMWKTLKRVVFDVGSALTPVLQRAADWIMRVAVTTSQWVRANRPLIVTALQVAAAVAATGAVLMALGATISFIGSVLGGLATIWSAIGTVVSAVGAVIGALISPVGLVVAAVVALGAAILYWTGAGGKAFEWLAQRFGTLRDDAVATFGGVADALMAGDISLAVKVLWLAIKMEWTRGVNWLQNIWYTAQAMLAKGFAALWYGALATGRVVWNALASGWEAVVHFMAGAWEGFALTILTVWEKIKAAAAKAWNYVKGLFDSGFDVEEANRAVDQARDAAVARAEQRTGESFGAREKKLAANRTTRDDKLVQIGQESLGVDDAIDAERARKVKENEDELTRARGEWQDALGEARRKREAADREKPFENSRRPAFEDVGPALREKMEVRGTFNAMNLLGLLAANSTEERTAKAAEATAKNTERMWRAMEDGEPAFE